MKVLIVDDNRALAFVLREVLEGEGFETEVATNGEEGYLTYLRFDPDCVITDICMPAERPGDDAEDLGARSGCQGDLRQWEPDAFSRLDRKG